MDLGAVLPELMYCMNGMCALSGHHIGAENRKIGRVSSSKARKTFVQHEYDSGINADFQVNFVRYLVSISE